MGQVLGDFIAVLRRLRLATGLPEAVACAYRGFRVLNEAYEDVVAPIVRQAISDPETRTGVDRALRAMSVKIGVALLSYARLTGCEPRLDVVALAGAVTRLYDDLIDGSIVASLDERLSDLFNAREFIPRGDLESLLATLVDGIRRRVRPSPGDTVDTALNALHDYQVLSRRQREEAVPLAVLEKICRGKGAMASLTLFSLVNPRMDAVERELSMALGECFQSLDDYMDVEQDARNGVITLVSLGITDLADIGARIRVLRDRLAARYGRAAARPYCGMIFFLLLKSLMARRLPAVGRTAARFAGRSAALAFLTRGADAIPAAPRYRSGS